MCVCLFDVCAGDVCDRSALSAISSDCSPAATFKSAGPALQRPPPHHPLRQPLDRNLAPASSPNLHVDESHVHTPSLGVPLLQLPLRVSDTALSKISSTACLSCNNLASGLRSFHMQFNCGYTVPHLDGPYANREYCVGKIRRGEVCTSFTCPSPSWRPSLHPPCLPSSLQTRARGSDPHPSSACSIAAAWVNPTPVRHEASAMTSSLISSYVENFGELIWRWPLKSLGTITSRAVIGKLSGTETVDSCPVSFSVRASLRTCSSHRPNLISDLNNFLIRPLVNGSHSRASLLRRYQGATHSPCSQKPLTRDKKHTQHFLLTDPQIQIARQSIIALAP